MKVYVELAHCRLRRRIFLDRGGGFNSVIFFNFKIASLEFPRSPSLTGFSLPPFRKYI